MPHLTSYGAAIWTNIGAAIVVTLLFCMVQCSHAKSIDVGGTAGWTSFESSQITAPNYGAWASSQKFFVGDSLVFKYAAGAHNVWQMKSQAAYQSCDFSGATLLDAGDSGFYTWRAAYPGGYYFSCDKGAEGVGTHCNYNQKLAILVSKIATTPVSAPSLSPLKAPPPNPNATTPSPSPLPLPPSPHSFTVPSPVQSPIAKIPVHAPAPTYAPWTAPVPAPIPSLPPTKPPILAPSSSPVPAPSELSPVLAPSSSPVLTPSSTPVPVPSSSPVLAPSSVPAPAPASTISPVPSPSMSPSSGPVASTPLASTPDSSSPPMPDLPEVPGGGPASDSPPPNAGELLSVQSWSSLVHSVIALLCLLLW